MNTNALSLVPGNIDLIITNSSAAENNNTAEYPQLERAGRPINNNKKVNQSNTGGSFNPN